MSLFSDDSDILKYEPVLFGDLHFNGQVICEGQGGQLCSGAFTISGENFISKGISSGDVIYLRSSDGSIDNAYEIVSVNSETELAVSTVRAGSDFEPVSPADNSDVYYRLCSYRPQCWAVMFELTEFFGLRPGNSTSKYGVEDILDAEVLRQVSTFGVISMAYASLGSGGDRDGFSKKSVYYRRLFEKGRERCRVSIDSGDDGKAEFTVIGGSLRLVRD